MRTLTLSLSLLALLLFSPAVLANDDPHCLIPRDRDTTGRYWTKDTSVSVWIAPSVRSDFLVAVHDAVNTWATHPKNSSGVVFTFVATEPVGGTNTLIFREAPLGLLPALYEMDAATKRATITINSAISNATAAGMTLMHEMGHTYGTLDCWECAPGTSVMVERPADLNDTNWPISPTDCDVLAAMLGMGAERKDRTGELPSNPGDNEPACLPTYHYVELCWMGGDCIEFDYWDEQGHCFE
jgi:hypothetical protein